VCSSFEIAIAPVPGLKSCKYKELSESDLNHLQMPKKNTRNLMEDPVVSILGLNQLIIGALVADSKLMDLESKEEKTFGLYEREKKYEHNMKIFQ
jgi:hypothetical protein